MEKHHGECIICEELIMDGGNCKINMKRWGYVSPGSMSIFLSVSITTLGWIMCNLTTIPSAALH